MHTKIDISIIIPVYKVEAYVGRCLDSLTSQEGLEDLHTECIIVDDCSPDASMQVVRSRLATYQGPIEFRLMQTPGNSGCSAARNLGMDQARGTYLCFIDSDDYLTPGAIRKLWTQVEQHPGVDLVLGTSEFLRKEALTPGYHYPFLKFGNYTESTSQIRKHYFRLSPVVWDKLIRRDIIEQIHHRLPPLPLHEDLQFCNQLYEHIHTLAVVRDTTYIYCIHPGSIMTEKTQADSYRATVSILRTMIETRTRFDRPLLFYIARKIYTLRYIITNNNEVSKTNNPEVTYTTTETAQAPDATLAKAPDPEIERALQRQLIRKLPFYYALPLRYIYSSRLVAIIFARIYRSYT